MRAHITAMSTILFSSPTRWNKILPLKINIFTWRTLNRRLPTRSNLDSRGIDLHSIRCPLCDDAIESEEHLFVYCKTAKETWSNIGNWWKITNVNIRNLEESITFAENAPITETIKHLFDMVVQSTIWHIWRFRNDMVFNTKQPNKHLILDNIKLSSYSWIRSRQKRVIPNWIEWTCDPCNALSSLL